MSGAWEKPIIRSNNLRIRSRVKLDFFALMAHNKRVYFSAAESKEVIANNVPNSGEVEHQAAETAAAEGAPSKDTPYDEEDETAEGDDDEKEETCGFCIFMKGGGCKDAFNVRTFSSGGHFRNLYSSSLKC